MKKSFIETRYFTVVLHILIWSTFFILQILSYQGSIPNNKPPRMEPFGPDHFYYRLIFHFIIMVGLFYLNTLLLMPYILFKGKIWKYIFSLILVLILVVIINYIFSSITEFRRPLFEKRPPITLFISVFILALSTSTKLAQKWYENETQRKEMDHEKVNSELSLLKSQVNPHFLFNTLNGIYSLANAKSDKTAPAIVKLSQLMRYMLDESKQRFVSLAREVDYINTFIELQKLRLFDNVKINFSIKGEAELIKIQPLLLIPFIENAFKHGVDSKDECFININLDIKESSVQLYVENDIHGTNKEEGRSGFGLANIKRRLELEYPSKHVISTEEREGKFIVKLFISLK